jgi:hypothetical protein
MVRGKAANESAVLSAAELMKLALPDPRWAIEELLPEGLIVLAGKPKCGKSWLVLLWATLIAGGQPFGTYPTSAGKVLYLALEDTRRRLKTRLEKLAVDGGSTGLFLTTDWMGGVTAMQDWLAANPGVRLVVIDTLARLAKERVPRPGESAYAADYETLAPMKKLADKFGVCVLVVTHTRKAGAADAFDGITGTRGVTGAADAMMVLSRTGSGGLLKLTGRDVECRDVHLTWEKVGCRWSPVGGRGELPLSPERQKALGALRGAGRPLTPKEVADATGGSVGAIRKLLREMAASDQVAEAGTHRYTVPEW